MVASPLDVVLMVMIRGKATVDKIGSLFSLVEEVLLRSRLDNQRRAIEILKESKARRYIHPI